MNYDEIYSWNEALALDRKKKKKVWEWKKEQRRKRYEKDENQMHLTAIEDVRIKKRDQWEESLTYSEKELLKGEKYDTVILQTRWVPSIKMIKEALNAWFKVVALYAPYDASSIQIEKFKKKYGSDIFQAVAIDSYTIWNHLAYNQDWSVNIPQTLAENDAAKSLRFAYNKALDIADVWALVFPWYWFDAENPFIDDFIRRLSESWTKNIIFWGPPASATKKTSCKMSCLWVAEKNNIPTSDHTKAYGEHEIDLAVSEFIKFREKISGSKKYSWRLRMKCTNGWWWRGQADVEVDDTPEIIIAKYLDVIAEAKNFWWDVGVYCEPYIDDARHIEVQITRDEKWNIVIYWYRDCSDQVKGQKTSEMTANPYSEISWLSQEVVAQLNTWINLFLGDKEIDYLWAWTFEFLLTDDWPLFMEMNTRIQVEHPTTENEMWVNLFKNMLNIFQWYEVNPTLERVWDTSVMQARICAQEFEFFGVRKDDYKIYQTDSWIFTYNEKDKSWKQNTETYKFNVESPEKITVENSLSGCPGVQTSYDDLVNLRVSDDIIPKNIQRLILKKAYVWPKNTEGFISHMVKPTGDWVICEFWASTWDYISSKSDSMFGILICEWFDEEDSCRKMIAALKKMRVEWVLTNIPLQIMIYEERLVDIMSNKRLALAKRHNEMRFHRINTLEKQWIKYILSEKQKEKLYPQATEQDLFLNYLADATENWMPLDSIAQWAWPYEQRSPEDQIDAFDADNLQLVDDYVINLMQSKFGSKDLYHTKVKYKTDAPTNRQTHEKQFCKKRLLEIIEDNYTDSETWNFKEWWFLRMFEIYWPEVVWWEIVPYMTQEMWIPLFTDTALRDSHQSNYQNRQRSNVDWLKIMEDIDKLWLFSIEAHGGACPDVELRNLLRDPLGAIQKINAILKNSPTQILWRWINSVWYGPADKKLVEMYLQMFAQWWVQVFRIFDSQNDLSSMEHSIKVVKKLWKSAEWTICYNWLDKDDESWANYTVEYYVNLVKSLSEMWCHSICIKDMAGCITPEKMIKLTTAIKALNLNLPIHFHTHSSLWSAVSSACNALLSWCDIVDVTSVCAWGLWQPDFRETLYQYSAMKMIKDDQKRIKEDWWEPDPKLSYIAELVGTITDSNNNISVIRDEFSIWWNKSYLDFRSALNSTKDRLIPEIDKIKIARDQLIELRHTKEFAGLEKYLKLLKHLDKTSEQIIEDYAPWYYFSGSTDSFHVLATLIPWWMVSGFVGQMNRENVNTKLKDHATYLYYLIWQEYFGRSILVTPSSKYIWDQVIQWTVLNLYTYLESKFPWEWIEKFIEIMERWPKIDELFWIYDKWVIHAYLEEINDDTRFSKLDSDISNIPWIVEEMKWYRWWTWLLNYVKWNYPDRYSSSEVNIKNLDLLPDELYWDDSNSWKWLIKTSIEFLFWILWKQSNPDWVNKDLVELAHKEWLKRKYKLFYWPEFYKNPSSRALVKPVSYYQSITKEQAWTFVSWLKKLQWYEWEKRQVELFFEALSKRYGVDFWIDDFVDSFASESKENIDNKDLKLKLNRRLDNNGNEIVITAEDILFAQNYVKENLDDDVHAEITEIVWDTRNKVEKVYQKTMGIDYVVRDAIFKLIMTSWYSDDTTGYRWKVKRFWKLPERLDTKHFAQWLYPWKTLKIWTNTYKCLSRELVWKWGRRYKYEITDSTWRVSIRYRHIDSLREMSKYKREVRQWEAKALWPYKQLDIYKWVWWDLMKPVIVNINCSDNLTWVTVNHWNPIANLNVMKNVDPVNVLIWENWQKFKIVRWSAKEWEKLVPGQLLCCAVPIGDDVSEDDIPNFPWPSEKEASKMVTAPENVEFVELMATERLVEFKPGDIMLKWHLKDWRVINKVNTDPQKTVLIDEVYWLETKDKQKIELGHAAYKFKLI